MDRNMAGCVWGRAVCVSLLSGVSGLAFASGFSLIDFSASEQGTAFAGTASSIEDASTVYANPAGVVRLGFAQLTGGFAFVDSSTDIENATGTFPGSNRGDMVDAAAIPFLYGVMPLNETIAVGIGLFVPYGMGTEYEPGFQGRYFGQSSRLEVISLQPVIAWKISPQWSIGVGPNWNVIKGELAKAIPNPATPGANDWSAKLEGDTTALGFTAGIHYVPFDGTAIGLAYHSQIKTTLEGETRLAIPGSAVREYDAEVDLALPDQWDLSVSQRLLRDWTLHASVKLTGWSSFDELRVDNEGLPDSVEPQEWHDAFLYAVGVSYSLNASWLLRVGVALDQSPIPGDMRGVRLPADDRTIYGIGARWILGRDLDVDFSYAYTAQPVATVDQQAGALAYHADYDTTISNWRMQVNWKFN